MPRYRCYTCSEDYFLSHKQKRCPTCYSQNIKDIYLIEKAIKNNLCIRCGEEIEYGDFYDNAVKQVYYEDGLCITCQKDNNRK